MLKVKHIKAICSTDTFNNALQLCQPGKIRKAKAVRLDQDSVTAKGLVLGNFGYYHQVQLALHRSKRNIVDGYDCDCYELTCRKGPCRHCIALGLALAEDGEVDLGCRLEPEEEEPEPALPVKEIFAAFQEPAAEAPASPLPVEEAPAVMHQETPAATTPEFPAEDDGPRRCMEILFGHELEEKTALSEYAEGEAEESQPVPLYWHPNNTKQVFHTNTGIIGTMGTGKTQFTKSLVTQLYRQQKNNFNGSPLGILIFDYKGDYNASKMDFVTATNAKVIRPYKIPFNPLSIVESRLFKPLLPVHTANTFKDTLSKVYRLGPKQQNTLLKCINKAYESMGIRADSPETWKNRAPTFDMVYEIYEQDEEIAKTDSLAAAMQKLQNFQLFEDNPYRTESLFDLLKGVVVIDLSGYDPDIQSLIVAITLDQFYSQMHAAGSSALEGELRQLTKLILVDEADNFMREEFPALKKIMKEGREFGVGTILSTQFLDHFTTGEDDYSKYILTWVVHNVADLKKTDVEYIFKVKLNAAETSQIYERIKRCDRFQSVVKIGNDQPRYIRDKAFFELDR